MENSMADLVTWVKDNGDEIKLNSLPATEAHAKEMGWKKKGSKSKQAK